MAQKRKPKSITIKLSSKTVECAEYDGIIYDEKADGTKIYKIVPTSIQLPESYTPGKEKNDD